MAIPFNVIEDAFFFVSAAQPYEHNAYLCKQTGQVFYTSEMGDSDALPEDLDESDKYVAIPHKNNLNLGRTLVFEFVEEYLPAELDKVLAIFRKRGAYSRYKDLLERKGFLQKWYQYEEDRQKAGLRDWCAENNIELLG